MLNYRYRTFLTLCHTLSYTGAAQELNITQPAVSNHIAYLENKLHVTLFTHQHKKVKLTPAGKLLCTRLTFLENFSADSLKQLSALQNTHIKIGYAIDLDEEYIQSFIKLMIEKQPELDLDIHMADTSTLIEQITTGEIQAAVIEGEIKNTELINLPIYTDEFIGIAAFNSHFFAESEAIINTNDIPLIIRKSIFNTFEFKLPNFKQKIFIDNPHLIKDLVKNDEGVTFALESSVKQELLKQELQKVPLSNKPVHISLIYKDRSPVIQGIIDLIATI